MEFEDAWIERIRARFHRPDPSRESIGIGDDAAVVPIPLGHRLVVSVDAQVHGTHFLHPWLDDAALGRRALEVSLSDLAAMGALAHGVVIAIETPELPGHVGESFWSGVEASLEAHGVELWGGNVCRTTGPLALSVTALGSLAPGESPLRRDGARIGDAIYVSGWPGRAGRARELLAASTSHSTSPRLASEELSAWRAPRARLELGRRLRTDADVSAAIDLSDGFLRDLRRVLAASGVGARLDLAPLCRHGAIGPPNSPAPTIEQILHGGEDYELLFTADPESVDPERLASAAGVAVTKLGAIVPRDCGPDEIDLRVGDTPISPTEIGWEHFRDATD